MTALRVVQLGPAPGQWCRPHCLLCKCCWQLWAVGYWTLLSLCFLELEGLCVCVCVCVRKEFAWHRHKLSECVKSTLLIELEVDEFVFQININEKMTKSVALVSGCT